MDIAYRIGRAVAQHFDAKSVVIGFDARETSPAFAAVRGVEDAQQTPPVDSLPSKAFLNAKNYLLIYEGYLV